MIKVLHINTWDMDGGAARAAYRINLGLRNLGVNSRMVVLNQRESNPAVMRPLGAYSKVTQKVKGLSAQILLDAQHSTNTVTHSLNFFTSGLADWINRSDANIVNLHWVGGEMISVEEIGRLNKPICWTMHDMWPFSGAEHYDDLHSPGRYQQGYYANNRPHDYSGLDLDAWVWRRKRKAWADKTFQLISPSHWLADCAGNSALFSKQPCRVIHNGIDLKRFHPLDRKQARSILRLREDRRYVLFGAISSTSDARKGFHLLLPAIRRLAAMPEFAGNTELLIFGANAPVNPVDFGLPVHYMGHLYDEISLAILYSAADVFASPSMQDNLPNTLVEALACGTPCVAFDIGGMQDLIEHEKTGYLVNAYDIEGLSAGLAQALADDGDSKREACRAKAEKSFGELVVAEKYLALYREMLFDQ
ncbi:MAG: glycosyltransferase [Gallionella sp.]|jgi:glycosyltransferase involved in cell wall biosynthesis|nr:glycosyltransferase [Gallionella sp.]